jgi:2-polyprenyl-3-methyl-5-hydroxy-6-metoxy-1,4-benzoquinol methylase
MEPDATAPKYWATPEQAPAIRAELELIPRGRRILEIGTAAGHVTRALSEKGCDIVGVELDAEQARLAARFCRRMIVGSIEDLDIDTDVPEEFDIVLCGDVLEHLKDPGAALQRLKRRLAPDGFFVVSIPNIAHASVRVSLLDGRFAYTVNGLLDSTHLRFFTLSSIVDLFNTHQLEIRDLRRIRVGVFESELGITPRMVDPSVIARIIRDPEATSYQFVFRAFPSSRRNTLADLADKTFDPEHESRRFATEMLREAWFAFHDRPPRTAEARTLARLALSAAPSVKALRYWLRSTLAWTFARR